MAGTKRGKGFWIFGAVPVSCAGALLTVGAVHIGTEAVYRRRLDEFELRGWAVPPERRAAIEQDLRAIAGELVYLASWANDEAALQDAPQALSQVGRLRTGTEDTVRLEQWLEELEKPLLEPLAEALRAPRCQEAIAAGAPFCSEPPRIADCRQLADVLCAQALVKARREEPREAALHLRDALDLAHALDDGSSDGLIVRANFFERALGTLRVLVEERSLPAVLALEVLDPVLARGFSATDRLAVLRHELRAIAYADAPASVAATDAGGPWARPLQHLEQTQALTSFGRVLEVVDGMATSDYLRERAELAPASPEDVDPLRDELVSIFEAELRGESIKNLARTALAALAFRERNERWPDEVAELSDEERWAVPFDPLTGRPFALQVQESGVRIGPALFPALHGETLGDEELEQRGFLWSFAKSGTGGS